MLKVSQWIKKGKKYLHSMTRSHAAMRYDGFPARCLILLRA